MLFLLFGACKFEALPQNDYDLLELRMKTFWTRVLLLFLTVELVACFQYPVDFGDPSVLRGNFTGTISALCQIIVDNMAWNSDGTKIATLDSRTGGRLTIWDNQSGAELSFVDNLDLPYPVNFLNWSLDGQRVIYSDSRNSVAKLHVYNVLTKVLETDVLLESSENYWVAKISANGNRVIGYQEQRLEGALKPIGANIRIWDSSTGKVVLSKHFDLSTYPAFTINKNGEEFAIWLVGTLQTWSVPNELKTHEWQLPGDLVRTLKYSNNDQTINALVETNTASLPISQFVRFDKTFSEGVWQAKGTSFVLRDFSPDGKLASVTFYAAHEPQNQLLNLETGVFSILPVAADSWQPGLFSPDGKSLLYQGNQSCSIKRYNLNQSQVQEFVLGQKTFQAINLQLVATWQDNKTYTITGTASIDAQTGIAVSGTGHSADDEYFVNPRTPATRPRRAELQFKDAGGAVIGIGMFWGEYGQGEPDTFRGEFQPVSMNTPRFNLVINRVP
jgi:WD40 repeat protein